jgi:hypothetical protein
MPVHEIMPRTPVTIHASTSIAELIELDGHGVREIIVFGSRAASWGSLCRDSRP